MHQTDKIPENEPDETEKDSSSPHAESIVSIGEGIESIRSGIEKLEVVDEGVFTSLAKDNQAFSDLIDTIDSQPVSGRDIPHSEYEELDSHLSSKELLAEAQKIQEDIAKRMTTAAKAFEEYTEAISLMESTNIQSADDIDLLNSYSQTALRAAASGREALDPLSYDGPVEPRLDDIYNAHSAALYKEANYSTVQQARDAVTKFGNDAWEFQRKWFGSMRFKNEIKECNRKYREASALTNLHKRDPFYVASIEPDQENLFLRKSVPYILTHIVEEKVTDRYRTIASELPEVHYEDQLDVPEITSLNEAYIENVVLPAFNKLPEKMQRDLDNFRLYKERATTFAISDIDYEDRKNALMESFEQDRDKAVAVITESFAENLGKNGKNYAVSGAVEDKIQDLPYDMRTLTKHFIYYGSTSGDESYQRIAAAAQYNTDPRVSALREAVNVVERLSNVKGVDYEKREQLAEAMEELKKKDHSESPDVFIDDFDGRRFGVFTESSVAQEHLGDRVSKNTVTVGNQVIAGLSRGIRNDDDRNSTDLGRALLHIPEPEYLPIAIVNAFRKFSRYNSSSYFTENQFGYGSELAFILAQVPDNSIDPLVPGLQELITLVRDHPNNFFQEEVVDPETQERKMNPVYPKVNAALYKMCTWTLQSADRNQQRLSLDFIIDDNNSGESINVIEHTPNGMSTIAEYMRCVSQSEAAAPHASFYSHKDVIMYMASHQDMIEESITLAEDQLLSKDFYQFYAENLSAIFAIERGKRQEYVEVFRRIVASPSQDLQRVRNELLEQVLRTSDPAAAFDKIELVFIRNNIPLVGKVFQVFEILHSGEPLKEKVAKEYSSPYLKNFADEHSEKNAEYHQLKTIYEDLAKTHVRTGNRSLRQFLLVLRDSEEALNQMESGDIDLLDEDDIARAEHCLQKMQTLFGGSRLAQGSDSSVLEIDTSATREERTAAARQGYTQLRIDLGIKEGQSVNDRLTQMFLRPLGFSTIDQVLSEMDDAKRTSNERGYAIEAQAPDGQVSIAAGDLLKGVDSHYIDSILQNGSVAKEYLGASSDSDLTPLDTDMSMVMEDDFAECSDDDHVKRFQGALNRSLASGYGDVLFALRDRGQWQVTDSETKEFDADKYELITTPAIGDRHFGIRTGFPATEIDYIMIKKGFEEESKKRENLYFEIAKNGYYIPVTDESGKIIFTSTMYEERRKAFAGLHRFDGDDITMLQPEDVQLGEQYRASPPLHENNIAQMVKTIESSEETLERISTATESVIADVLREYDIELKTAHDTSMGGARLYDIGSTGRLTNMPGDYDFDLALKLDSSALPGETSDFEKSEEIATKMKERLQAEVDNSHGEDGGYYQLRVEKAKGIDGDPDVDIGFAKNSELTAYGSHDAVREKLDRISEAHGQDAYRSVQANIIVAKQILKKGEAYKKLEHGGLGGIGVENWILQNGGNFLEASRSFLEAAEYQGPGEHLSYENFAKKYTIRDPGTNIKFMKHDEFIAQNLKPEGYTKMLAALDTYLKGGDAEVL